MHFYVDVDVTTLVLGQVDGMDCLAVKQAVKFAKEYALKNGPMVTYTFKRQIQFCVAILIFLVLLDVLIVT